MPSILLERHHYATESKGSTIRGLGELSEQFFAPSTYS